MSDLSGFPPTGDTRKWACYTKAGGRVYPLPGRVGQIVSVVYRGREYPIVLTLFEVPTTRAYLMRVYSMNSPPTSRKEAFTMLKAAHGTFSYRPLWHRFDDELLIWPPTPNEGEIITVEYLAEEED